MSSPVSLIQRTWQRDSFEQGEGAMYLLWALPTSSGWTWVRPVHTTLRDTGCFQSGFPCLTHSSGALRSARNSAATFLPTKKHLRSGCHST